MDERIRQIAQDVYTSNSSRSVFNIASVPFHVHSGQDSSNISFKDLTSRFFTISYTLPGITPATTTNYSVFYTALFDINISKVTEVHTTLGTSANGVIMGVEKLTGTTAPGSGSIMVYNYGLLTATVGAGGTNYSVNDTIIVKGANDASSNPTGSGTSLAVLKVLTLSGSAVATVAVQSSGNYNLIPGSPLTQVSSSGSGTGATFTFTSAQGFDLRSTINTVITGVPTPLTNNLRLKAGDRIGLTISGTPTAVANVTVTLLVNF